MKLRIKYHNSLGKNGQFWQKMPKSIACGPLPMIQQFLKSMVFILFFVLKGMILMRVKGMIWWATFALAPVSVPW